MESIISWLGSARDYLYNAYVTVDGWIFPFKYLATPLLYIWQAFFYLTYYASDFNNWLEWAYSKITQILDWNLIKSKILEWFPALQSVYDWWGNWWNSILSKITDWWNASNNPIRLYIDQAITAIKALPDQLVSEFNAVKTAWSNFCQYTFPQWIATVQDWWNQFRTFVASIGQTILDHLTAFWNDTILPAINTIKQDIASLHIPSWDDIWSFIFSKLPWLPKAFAFFEILWEDITGFFNNPTVWLTNIIDLEFIGDDLSEGVKASGGTDENVADIASTLPSIKTVSDELIDILSSEELMKADEFWADVELILTEVTAELEAAEKKGSI